MKGEVAAAQQELIEEFGLFEIRGDAGILGPINLVETTTNRNTPWGAWVWDIHEEGNEQTIEYNEIHNVMETMGDGNGIYIRGAGAGNVIRRNYVHHLVTPMKMQAAIRTDGGQRDTLIAENLIYKCMAQGIILKLDNRCENNIVADIIAPPRGNYLSSGFASQVRSPYICEKE